MVGTLQVRQVPWALRQPRGEPGALLQRLLNLPRVLSWGLVLLPQAQVYSRGMPFADTCDRRPPIQSRMTGFELWGTEVGAVTLPFWVV